VNDADGFEQVYTVHEWFDGPRVGVADFRGVPCLYLCSFDYDTDDWRASYELRNLDPATIALLKEDFTIWRRWSNAFEAGSVSADSRPALPEDRERSIELHDLLYPLERLKGKVIAEARPEFRGRSPDAPHASVNEMQVRWHDVAGRD
jgi:hypothetical protein